MRPASVMLLVSALIASSSALPIGAPPCADARAAAPPASHSVPQSALMSGLHSALHTGLQTALHSAVRPEGGEVRGRITAAGRTAVEDGLRRFLLLNRYVAMHMPPIDLRGAATDASGYTLGEKAVVWLESPRLARMKPPPPARHPTLDQRGLMFHPQVMAVSAGTTVDFPNSDNVFHNVFSYSEPREFDLGRYPKGESRPVRFDEPGIVRVYCDIHAHMNATVIVLTHPYFATPDDDGQYVIRNVPDGDYTVVFWYGRDKADERRITIRGGQTATADFTY